MPVTVIRFTESFENHVNFAFGSGIRPGESSNFFLFNTTATNYSKTAFYDLDSAGKRSASGSFDAFTPAVPEPNSLLMYTWGLAMLFGAVRNRRRRSA